VPSQRLIAKLLRAVPVLFLLAAGYGVARDLEFVHYYHTECSRLRPFDADGDGVDEFFQLQPEKYGVIDHSFAPVWDRYYQGSFSRYTLVEPGDIDGDGRDGFVMLFNERDTTWLTIWEPEVPDSQFAWVPIVPRTQPDRSRPTVTTVNHPTARVLDADGDGLNDIVVAGEVGAWNTADRGVWAYDPRLQRQLWHFRCGVIPGFVEIADFDEDGAMEMVFAGYAISNGNEAGGMSDYRSWVFCLRSSGELLWKHAVGGPFYHASSRVADLDGDGQLEVVVLEGMGKVDREEPARLMVLDAVTGEPLSTSSAGVGCRGVAVGNFHGGGELEIAAGSLDDTIRLYSHRLEVLRRRHFETSVTAIEAVDLDRHGRPEILSVTGRNSVLVLGADLKQVAELTLPEPFSLLLPPVRAPGATGLVIADVSARPDDRVALHSVYNVVPVPVQLPVWVFIAAIAGVFLVSVLVVFAVSSGYRAQMNSMLRGLVKGAGVVRLNPQGRVTSMNREARELLGVPGMLSNRDFARVCREQGLLLLGAFVSSGVASEERSHSSELAFSAGEGETRRNLLARLVRLRRGSILTVEDISAVEYLKRVQTWIPVARRLAHSIKNPLTAMNLNIRQIEKRQGDGEDRAGQYLRSMKEEVTRLQGMTDGFMKLTRLEEPALEPSDIRQVVRAALEKLASTGSDSIRLAERYEDGLPPVMLDAEQMRMAVSNVVENAVAAMEGRGTLTIAASSDQPGRVRLDVTDTGPGIPDEFLERLFEPYFTLKKGGTGLGMAITKKVVEDHHGEIRVTSRAGEGTMVSILIPAAESGSGTESARG